MRCPNCGKRRLVPADDITSEIEGYTFVEQGLRCASCGEEFIPEEQSQRMIRVARRRAQPSSTGRRNGARLEGGEENHHRAGRLA